MNEYLEHLLQEKGIEFDFTFSTQFATVIYERDRDDENNDALITIIRDRNIYQMENDNRFNPSLREDSSSIYIMDLEDPKNVVKFSTIKHKGMTLFELFVVDEIELICLFDNDYMPKSPEEEMISNTKNNAQYLLEMPFRTIMFGSNRELYRKNNRWNIKMISEKVGLSSQTVRKWIKRIETKVN